MGQPRFTLRRAGTGDLNVVNSLLSDASRWLEPKDTDQGDPASATPPG
jgi:hypothetical protein